jgi:hypothetical protein
VSVWIYTYVIENTPINLNSKPLALAISSSELHQFFKILIYTERCQTSLTSWVLDQWIEDIPSLNHPFPTSAEQSAAIRTEVALTTNHHFEQVGFIRLLRDLQTNNIPIRRVC